MSKYFRMALADRNRSMHLLSNYFNSVLLMMSLKHHCLLTMFRTLRMLAFHCVK